MMAPRTARLSVPIKRDTRAPPSTRRDRLSRVLAMKRKDDRRGEEKRSARQRAGEEAITSTGRCASWSSRQPPARARRRHCRGATKPDGDDEHSAAATPRRRQYVSCGGCDQAAATCAAPPTTRNGGDDAEADFNSPGWRSASDDGLRRVGEEQTGHAPAVRATQRIRPYGRKRERSLPATSHALQT